MHIQLAPYLQLGKFRLSLLVVFTTLIGYGCSEQSHIGWSLVALLIGTLLSAMGANGLNQWWERDRDAQMQRTRNRPIPSGALSAAQGLIGASLMLVAGVLVLWIGTNVLTAWLSVLVAGIYLFVYTPLKTHHCIAVLVGAIPGAIPPMMGWSAANNAIEPPAWVLFCLLYLWQIPHFMALAAMHQQDYSNGGYHMLPDNPGSELATRAIIVVFCVALLVISILLPLIGLGKLGFLFGALLGGGFMLFRALRLYMDYSHANARQVFVASLIYLPVSLTALLVDQRLTFFSL